MKSCSKLKLAENSEAETEDSAKEEIEEEEPEKQIIRD